MLVAETELKADAIDSEATVVGINGGEASGKEIWFVMFMREILPQA
jgi:hypothetical protein